MYTAPYQKVNYFRCLTSANINQSETFWTLDFLCIKHLIFLNGLLFKQLAMYFFLFLIIRHGETYSKTLGLINCFNTNKTHFYKQLNWNKAGNFPCSPHNSLWRHMRANTVWSAALIRCYLQALWNFEPHTKHIFSLIFSRRPVIRTFKC